MSFRGGLVLAVAAVWTVGVACKSTGLSSSHGELLVVTVADGGEQLSADASVQVADVAMGDQGTSAVVFRNVGSAPVTIVGVVAEDDAGVWGLDGLLGQTVAPDTELSASVVFQPPQAADLSTRAVVYEESVLLSLAGTRAEAASVRVDLRGNAIARDCYVPDHLDFGAVTPGTSISMPLVLQNGRSVSSTTTFGALGGTDPAAFSAPQASQVVPPGGQVSVFISFSPSEARPYSASVEVSRGGSCGTATMRLTGVGQLNALAFAPTTLELGKVPLGSVSRAGVVTITNLSAATLHFAELTVSPSDFVLKATPSAVGPAGTTTLSVSCAPQSLGPLEGTLRFTLDTTPRFVGQVALSCQGGGPKLNVSPNPLSFGQTPFLGEGQLAGSRRLTIQNLGTPPASPSDTSNNLFLGLNGKPPLVSLVPASPGTLAAEFEVTVASTYDPALGVPAVFGANAVDLEVRFKPQTLGQKLVDLLLYTNDAASPVTTVRILAQAVELAPCSALTASPSSLFFGDVPRGAATARTVAIQNAGSSPCRASIDLTPGTAPVFSVVTASNVVIPAGGQVQVSLLASIGADAAQASIYQGYLRIQSRGNGALNVIAVPLDVRVATCLLVTPTSLAFGSTGVGCRSADEAVTLSSTCSTPLSILGVPTPSGPFARTSGPLIPDGGLSLQTQPLTYTVGFVPTDAGVAAGALTFAVEEGGLTRTEAVPLSGLGTASSTVIDSFTEGKGDVDILFVVDDSCSMTDKQQALAANFQYFIQHAQVTNSNFHLGVTTTDAFSINGALQGTPPYLTSSTPSYSAEFSRRALVGTGGSGWEQPFEGLLRAVTPPKSTTTNAGFLRDGVPLVVVIVTDAVEQSAKPVGTYLSQLLAVKGDRLDLLNVSVVGPFDTAPGCTLDTTVDTGRYRQLVAPTHGLTAEICTANWAHDLDAIGQNALGRAKRFHLSSVPVAATVGVSVDGAPASGWVYDASAGEVVFATAPKEGAAISITYSTVCNPP